MTADAVRTDVTRRVGPCQLTVQDREALRAIGIEVDQIRARVEESFGPGALERAGFPRHLPFSPRSEKVMGLSLREALRLRHDYVGTEHILLALLPRGRDWRRGCSPTRGCEPTTFAAGCWPRWGAWPEPAARRPVILGAASRPRS